MKRGIRGRKGAASSDYVIWTILGLVVLGLAFTLLYGSGSIVEKIKAYAGGQSTMESVVSSCNVQCGTGLKDIILDDGSRAKATCANLKLKVEPGCFVGGDVNKRIKTATELTADTCKNLEPKGSVGNCKSGADAIMVVNSLVTPATLFSIPSCDKNGLNPKWVTGWDPQDKLTNSC